MQDKDGFADPPNGFSSHPVRRSASGASTHSHDSSMTRDLEYNPGPETRYAPIRPMSQAIGRPQEGFPVAVQSFDGDHSALQQVHQYNSAQAPMMHPQVAAFHGQGPQFAPYDGPMQPHFHALSEGPDSRPASRQQRAESVSMSINGTTLTGIDGDSRAKKAANANAANERELRELIESNAHRSLESIAKDVRGAEKTQKAEKAKQLFAMRWLKEYCRHDKESVPRNRVYTYYTQRCGSERVDTLNPASFGKLVRVIFPGIATRRLGVRGESKYHYVNLSLSDNPTARGAAPAPRTQSAEQAQTATAEQGDPFDPQLSGSSFERTAPESALFPTRRRQSIPLPPNIPVEPPPPNQPSKAHVFAEPDCQGYRHDLDGPQMYSQTLRFSNAPDTTVQSGALEIPNIKPYLPAAADPDLGDNLEALYRTHCTSLIDNVRYVKEKSFFKLLNGFNGQMTVPVAKLFQHPNLTPWIRRCDVIMYQHIIRFVSQLALQVIPLTVYSMLGRIGNELGQHMRNNFRNYPDHVLQAKLEPARVFSSLMQRLLRVNEMAHAAANLLMNEPLRAQMWRDWVKSVRPKQIIQSELFGCGEEETYDILTKTIRSLMEPLPLGDFMELGTEFETDMHSNGGPGVRGVPSSESIIERWSAFLRTVPARFPKASTRQVLYSVNAITSAVLRDITVNKCDSFGGWWITKAFVDETMHWLAEMGGFLDTRPVVAVPDSTALEPSFDGLPTCPASAKSKNRPGMTRSQSTAGVLDLDNYPILEPDLMPHRPSSGPPMTTFAMPPPRHTVKSDALGSFNFDDQHDDSGIGMSLLEDSMHPHPSFSSGEHAMHDDFSALLQ